MSSCWTSPCVSVWVWHQTWFMRASYWLHFASSFHSNSRRFINTAVAGFVTERTLISHIHNNVPVVRAPSDTASSEIPSWSPALKELLWSNINRLFLPFQIHIKCYSLPFMFPRFTCVWASTCCTSTVRAVSGAQGLENLCCIVISPRGVVNRINVWVTSMIKASIDSLEWLPLGDDGGAGGCVLAKAPDLFALERWQ